MNKRTNLQVRMDEDMAKTLRTIASENKLSLEGTLFNLLKISAKTLIQDNDKLKQILSEYIRK